jgi:hypothetical protein
MRLKPVQESRYGVYVWRMPNGDVVGDDQGNFMQIQAEEGDLKRVQAITEAARSFGITEGAPYFLPGRRPVDDEEHQRQKTRLELGLIPDEYDWAAWAEEEKRRRQNDR